MSAQRIVYNLRSSLLRSVLSFGACTLRFRNVCINNANRIIANHSIVRIFTKRIFVQRCSHKFSLIRYGIIVNHQQSTDIYLNSYSRERNQRNGIAKYLFFLLDVVIDFSCIYGKLEGVKMYNIQKYIRYSK